MNKRDWAIMLRSRKVELENFFEQDEETHRKGAKTFDNYRRKFFLLMDEYYDVLDRLLSPKFRRIS